MNYKEALAFFNSNDNFLLITHKNPDGDTVGSACALCSALRRVGKSAFVYNNPGFVNKMQRYTSRYITKEFSQESCVVAVDIASPALFPDGFSNRVDFCIDHHPSNALYAERSLIKADKASCGEIIYKLISQMNIGITTEEATLLYLAVSTDTGCFQYTNTTSDTFLCAAGLLKANAENVSVNNEYFRKKSYSRLMLESLIIRDLSLHFDNRVAIALVTLDMISKAKSTEEDMDNLAGIAGQVSGTDISITIREMSNGTSKVSVRSDGSINCSELCSVFGGGGHSGAAGCTVTTTPVKTKELLIEVLQEVLG